MNSGSSWGFDFYVKQGDEIDAAIVVPKQNRLTHTKPLQKAAVYCFYGSA
jgi:hypothetical protein